MIAIIDLNLGNIGSIRNMIKKIGAESVAASTAGDIKEADKIVFPGIGTFDSGMTKLKELGLDGVLRRKVLEQGTPLLSICLGMQLLTKRSDEGKLVGLGWVNAETIRFSPTLDGKPLRIPHIGWNYVSQLKSSKLLEDLEECARFYFVHSYFVSCLNQEDVLTETYYGHPFTSSIEKDNILAVQFHPEKSHKFGMKLFRNFIEKY